MVYSIVVGLLLGSAALALEESFARVKLPARWIWLSTMLASLALSVHAASTRPQSQLVAQVGVADAVLPEYGRVSFAVGLADSGVGRAVQDVVQLADGVSRLLVLIWVLASLYLLLRLLHDSYRLTRACRGWSRGVVQGIPVYLSDDVGPAVVGWRRLAIVLPRWVLDTPEEWQRLAILHEEEHVRSGDARLLQLALILLLLMPWNPALWWQVRRLRQAVEVDCDSRVLRNYGTPRSYGALLLEAGRRRWRSTALVVPISNSTRPLERRIRMMSRKHSRRYALAGGPLALLSVILATAACEAPHPYEFAAVGDVGSTTVAGVRSAGSEQYLRQLIEENFPDVLTRGVQGDTALVYFVATKHQVENAVLVQNAGTGLQEVLDEETRALAADRHVTHVAVLWPERGVLGPDVIVGMIVTTERDGAVDPENGV
jgi:bla regulator protein blaR1